MEHNTKRAGFTVVELLVVIVVTAICALLVWMPLNNYKKRAQRITCHSNLAQIGVAFRVSEPDIVNTHNFALSMADLIDQRMPNVTAIAAAVDGGQSPYTYQFFGVMSNELYNPKLLVCPTDQRRALQTFNMAADNSTDASKLLNQNVSYFVGRDVQEGLPDMIQGGDRNVGTGETGPNSAYGYSPNPEINTGFAKELGTNNATVRWTAKMHNNRGNVLFADGHVEGLSSKGLCDALKFSRGTNAGPNLILFP